MRLSNLATVSACLILPCIAVADQARTASTSVTVTPVIKTDRNIAGQPIVFPQKDGEITATVYEFPPGSELPIHKHPFPRLGYVLAGTVEIVDDDSGKSQTLKTGDMLVEEVDRWHHGKNTGEVPVRMLVIDLAPKGAKVTIPKK